MPVVLICAGAQIYIRLFVLRIPVLWSQSTKMDEDENSEPGAGENLRSALEVTPERKHKPRESPISPKHNNAEDLDEIARRLLHGKFLLSALEFHTELTEIGQEIPRLKEFFSNPGNFEVQSTLEPLISLSKFGFM